MVALVLSCDDDVCSLRNIRNSPCTIGEHVHGDKLLLNGVQLVMRIGKFGRDLIVIRNGAARETVMTVDYSSALPFVGLAEWDNHDCGVAVNAFVKAHARLP